MSNFIKNEDFDWSIYEDGYNGHNLKKNSKVVVPKDGSRTKVYCHESYAQELFNLYNNIPSTNNFIAKDNLKNAILSVTDIYPVSRTEVIVDTIGGGSARIDLTKDKEYLASVGCDTVDIFINSLNKSKTFKTELLKTMPVVKVLSKDRISLWEGHLAKTEAEFHEQIKNPTSAYYATLESINNGGYIANIQNVKCFLPGSLAQANKIIDYDVLVGKTIPVMIDSWQPKTGFIVSYKKYLKTILPYKIDEELSVGMAIDAEVTGVRKNNVFLQFPDSNGDMIFTGLLPYDNCSDEIKKDIETGQFKPGGKWRVYIYSLNEDHNRNKRIVFCDRPLEEMNVAPNDDSNTSNDADNNHDNSDVIIDTVNDNSLVAHITQTETLQVNNLVAKIG